MSVGEWIVDPNGNLSQILIYFQNLTCRRTRDWYFAINVKIKDSSSISPRDVFWMEETSMARPDQTLRVFYPFFFSYYKKKERYVILKEYKN